MVDNLEYNKERTNALLAKGKFMTVYDEEEIIKLNRGLVGAVLKKFGLVHDREAESIGYITLFKAIRAYNTKSGTQFSTFATVSIYNHLGSYVRSLNTLIATNTCSYDALVDEENTYLTFLESSDTADGKTLHQCGIHDIMQYVYAYHKATQNPVHKEILRLWIESGFKMKHTDIAAQLKCSQSYVTQVINKFRKSLKHKLKEE